VQLLVFRGSNSIAAQFVRLLGIHAQNFSKCEQS
jgi:hypothetical protein